MQSVVTASINLSYEQIVKIYKRGAFIDIFNEILEYDKLSDRRDSKKKFEFKLSTEYVTH